MPLCIAEMRGNKKRANHEDSPLMRLLTRNSFTNVIHNRLARRQTTSTFLNAGYPSRVVALKSTSARLPRRRKDRLLLENSFPAVPFPHETEGKAQETKTGCS